MFSKRWDTIANNLAIGVDEIDKLRLLQTVTIAKICEMIDELWFGIPFRNREITQLIHTKSVYFALQ